MKLTKIARAATGDVIALLTVLVISSYMHVVYHLPAAVTIVQVLGIELLLQVWPLSRLRFDHNRHEVRDTHDGQVMFELVLFGLLAGVLAYLNFLLFFTRHHLSPIYIDSLNPQYHEAIALTILTLVLCQFVHLVFVRTDADKHFELEHILTNKRLNQAWLLSGFILLNMIYDPLFQFVFNTKPLSLLDWFWAIIFAAVYAGLRLLQRHSREHTRHSVVKLHHEVHKTKA